MSIVSVLTRNRADQAEPYEAVKPILDKQKPLDEEIERLKGEVEALED